MPQPYGVSPCNYPGLHGQNPLWATGIGIVAEAVSASEKMFGRLAYPRLP